jgi:predicted deacylase
MMRRYSDPEILLIGDTPIRRGEEKTLRLHLSKQFDDTELSMPVRIIRGPEPGPVLFVSGAVHGDEIIGPEIIRRVLAAKQCRLMAGTLLAIPIVNIFGYNAGLRYLPDRRDLNRLFPGSKSGSLGAQVAYTFLNEIIKKSHFGIDLHSAAQHRSNLPQIRACLDDPETEALAMAFAAPVILNSRLRDGSIRAEAETHDVKIMLFEGGEALRFDEQAIRVGKAGVLRVMQHIGLIPATPMAPLPETYRAKSSYWVRAPSSGSMHAQRGIGARVSVNSRLGVVTDVFGDLKLPITSRTEGLIIGENRIPLVNRGDALFHIATFEDSATVRELYKEEAEITG